MSRAALDLNRGRVVDRRRRRGLALLHGNREGCRLVRLDQQSRTGVRPSANTREGENGLAVCRDGLLDRLTPEGQASRVIRSVRVGNRDLDVATLTLLDARHRSDVHRRCLVVDRRRRRSGQLSVLAPGERRSVSLSRALGLRPDLSLHIELGVALALKVELEVLGRTFEQCLVGGLVGEEDSPLDPCRARRRNVSSTGTNSTCFTGDCGVACSIAHQLTVVVEQVANGASG